MTSVLSDFPWHLMPSLCMDQMSASCLELDGGGLAYFELEPGETSIAVGHRTEGEEANTLIYNPYPITSSHKRKVKKRDVHKKIGD